MRPGGIHTRKQPLFNRFNVRIFLVLNKFYDILDIHGLQEIFWFHLVLNLNSGTLLVTGASAEGTSSKQDGHLVNINISGEVCLNFFGNLRCEDLYLQEQRASKTATLQIQTLRSSFD